MEESGAMIARGILTTGADGFAVGEFEVDPPGPGEVLVALRASGVCHTDWDVKRNAKDRLVMGHEGAGVVMQTGAGVEGLEPGDHVALNWAVPCGRCFQCVRGNQALCESKPVVPRERTRLDGFGIRRAFALGTMATHTVVRHEACIRIDRDIPFASAAVVGCGVMTGVGSVLNAARVEPGSTVVVLGCGGVGLNCIQGARIAGAARIVAIDVLENRLALARQFGATGTILADRGDVGLLLAAQEVKKLTDGRGADYSFECTAIPEMGAAPLAMIRNGGTAVQASGIEKTIPFNMELFEWDKTYINPLYGKCVPGRDFPRLLRLYKSGMLKLDELVTPTYGLGDLAAAFEDMKAGRIAKAVLTIDS
jgi:Zn-dependent alcohol dehydrogenase